MQGSIISPIIYNLVAHVAILMASKKLIATGVKFGVDRKRGKLRDKFTYPSDCRGWRTFTIWLLAFADDIMLLATGRGQLIAQFEAVRIIFNVV